MNICLFVYKPSTLLLQIVINIMRYLEYKTNFHPNISPLLIISYPISNPLASIVTPYVIDEVMLRDMCGLDV